MEQEIKKCWQSLFTKGKMRGRLISYDEDIYLDDHNLDQHLLSASRDGAETSSVSVDVRNRTTPKAVDMPKNVTDVHLEPSSNVEMQAPPKPFEPKETIRDRLNSAPGDLGSRYSMRNYQLTEKAPLTTGPNTDTKSASENEALKDPKGQTIGQEQSIVMPEPEVDLDVIGTTGTQEPGPKNDSSDRDVTGTTSTPEPGPENDSSDRDVTGTTGTPGPGPENGSSGSVKKSSAIKRCSGNKTRPRFASAVVNRRMSTRANSKRSATDEPSQRTKKTRLNSETTSTKTTPAEKQQLATLQKGQRIVLRPRTGATTTQKDLLAQCHLPANETPQFRVKLPAGVSEIVYQHGVRVDAIEVEPGRDFLEALCDAGPILMAEYRR